MPFLELSAHLDQKATQSFSEMGNYAGLTGPNLPHQSFVLSQFQQVALTGFG
jgi:hypothetical protein